MQPAACAQDKPDAIFIGLPPQCHGSIDDPECSVELELAEVRLPPSHVFPCLHFAFVKPNGMGRLVAGAQAKCSKPKACIFSQLGFSCQTLHDAICQMQYCKHSANASKCSCWQADTCNIGCCSSAQAEAEISKASKGNTKHGAHDEHALSLRRSMNLQAGIHLFVEKPLSVKHPDEVQRLSERLQEIQKEKNLIIAVGYMLRYSPAVEVSYHSSLAIFCSMRDTPCRGLCIALQHCRH